MAILTARSFTERTISSYRDATATFIAAARRKHIDDERTIARLEARVQELEAELKLYASTNDSMVMRGGRV